MFLIFSRKDVPVPPSFSTWTNLAGWAFPEKSSPLINLSCQSIEFKTSSYVWSVLEFFREFTIDPESAHCPAVTEQMESVWFQLLSRSQNHRYGMIPKTLPADESLATSSMRHYTGLAIDGERHGTDTRREWKDPIDHHPTRDWTGFHILVFERVVGTKGKRTHDLTMGFAPIYIVWKSQQPENLKRSLRQTPADSHPRAVCSIYFCSIR